MAESFLDPVLGWLLFLDPALGILIISIIVSLIITLAVKLFTNQSLMKDLKDEMKELQKQMKALKNNPGKLAKTNTQFMQTNMKYMSHSMRPTLFTFIPIILVFGWLNSHIGYYPLTPNEPFEITAVFADNVDGVVKLNYIEGIKILDGPEKEVLTNEVNWLLSAGEGEYQLELEFKDKKYTKDIIITDERKYAQVEKSFKKGLLSSADENGFSKIIVGNEKILPFVKIPLLKNIPWVSGWSWFGAYILFSIVFSMAFRKVFKIY